MQRLDLGELRYTGLFVGQGIAPFGTVPILGVSGSTGSVVYGDLKLYNTNINYLSYGQLGVFGDNGMQKYFTTTPTGLGFTGTVQNPDPQVITFDMPIEPRNRALDMYNSILKHCPTECFELNDCHASHIKIPHCGGVFKLNLASSVTLTENNSIVFEGSEHDVYYIIVNFDACSSVNPITLSFDYQNTCNKVVNFGCVKPENVFWLFNVENRCQNSCDNYCLNLGRTASVEFKDNNFGPCVNFLGNIIAAPSVGLLFQNFNLIGRCVSFGATFLSDTTIKIPCCFDLQPTLADLGNQNRAALCGLKDLHCDVARVQASLDELHTDVDKVQTSLDELHKDVDKVQTSVDELHKDVENVQKDTDELQKDTCEIKKSLSCLHNETGAIQCALDNLSCAFVKLVKYITHKHHKHN